MCKALEYNKKIAHVSVENYAQKVWFEQGAHSGHLFRMAPWLEKTTLKSFKWPVCPQRAHLWIGQKTHKNMISILLQIKSFTEILHKSSCLCSRENYAQKYQMTGVHGSCTPVNWPKDSQKYDLYINEEGMYDMGISGGDYDED